ncbi:MAG: cytidylate kinase-like family protein [Clostridia bacterium]|nr:cytidylate kinase-like family protein [Clostridia bacterium]
MKKNLVITISREFGSGGREIGERVAKELNIPFYDREIILKTAENSGLSEEYIEKEEQKVTSSLLFNLSAGGKQEFPALADRIFISQSGAIQEYAQEGSCVIVGRCADYILKENKNCLNIFVHADKYFKLHRIMTKYGLDQNEAEKKIKETDKRRSRHYRFYTSQEWGDASNYHVCINSGKLGIDNAVNLILNIANNF